MSLRSFHYSINGVVQGVGFRQFLKRRAETYGIVGWTRNTSTGDVVGVAEGLVDAMERFEKALHTGPSHATVVDVKLSEDREVSTLKFDKFEIRRG
ncbi:hypothetical protein QCA50_004902 [Cerrena zonata]|uniref:acylphosphatase n=1 Tax=Cerrena zonata TaxID=2478898 RepID=A0AAW0GMS8_9APHY